LANQWAVHFNLGVIAIFLQVDRLKANDLEDDILRKIGRSVVNFQKLEGMLKSISWVSSYAG